MSENTMHVRLPALPDPGIFKNPDHTIMTADGQALLSYDPVTRAAFIYSLVQQRWTITAPVDFDVFASLVALAGYSVIDSDDARRWLGACMASTLARQSKH